MHTKEYRGTIPGWIDYSSLIRTSIYDAVNSSSARPLILTLQFKGECNFICRECETCDPKENAIACSEICSQCSSCRSGGIGWWIPRP